MTMPVFIFNFTPIAKSTRALAATQTTTSVNAGTFTEPTKTRQRAAHIYNAGPSLAFVEIGGSTVTAGVPSGSTLGSVPVAVGTYIILGVEAGPYVAAICGGTGTSALYITYGNGAA